MPAHCALSRSTSIFAAPAPEYFTRPEGFRWFDGIDAARADDHREGQRQAASEAPLSAGERRLFLGRWELDGAADEQVLEVSETAAGYVVKTIEGSTVRTEEAALLGRRLRVDEAPNYRLYQLTQDGRLALVGETTEFQYQRVH